LLTGGDIQNKLNKMKRPYKEKDAAVIFEKLLRAINHCHSLGIIHRDIKPENIMYD